MERAGYAGLLHALLLITCEMKVNHLTRAYVCFLLYKSSVLLSRPSVKGKNLKSTPNHGKTKKCKYRLYNSRKKYIGVVRSKPTVVKMKIVNNKSRKKVRACLHWISRANPNFLPPQVECQGERQDMASNVTKSYHSKLPVYKTIILLVS